jgi:hypothetical protein
MTGNIVSIGAALDSPQDLPDLARPSSRDDDTLPPDQPRLPADCPVKPLGVLAQTHYYLDSLGQLISLGPREHSKQHIEALFGVQSSMLREIWPRFAAKADPKTGEVSINGWKADEAAEHLKRCAAWQGIFDPQGRVRGRGAHRGDNGELIIHCGDRILIGGRKVTGGPAEPRWYEPGLLGKYVYPTAPAMPRPWQEEVDDKPAVFLLGLFKQWSWARSQIDPYLLLGVAGAAMVAGALAWRPHAWLTGGSGTGKSTLQKIFELMFGNGALTTGDATPASVRQLLQQQTLPVFFDELEAEAEGGRAQKIVELARLASSGAQTFRGGTDHKASEFTVRSSFIFSSILVPPMPQQDRNRLAMLELEELPRDAKAPDPYTLGLPEIGRKIRRRLLDQWWRWDETLALYKTALARYGHNGRSADQFGTLLAIADLMIYEHEADLDVVEEWAEQLRAEALAEKIFERTDSDECAEWLASSELRGRGGDERETIARAMARAIAINDVESNHANRRQRLRSIGIAVGNLVDKGEGLTDDKRWGFRDFNGGEAWVAIANTHRLLDEVFDKSRWRGGTWAQSFQRARNARRRIKVKFDGRPIWATVVPIELFLGTVEEPE